MILKIDGISVTGNSQDEVARKIAGAEGTSVRISYRIRKYFQVAPSGRKGPQARCSPI